MRKFEHKLIVKYLVEELTAEEQESLLNWRNQSDENAVLYATITKCRIGHQYDVYNTPKCIEEALTAINDKIDSKPLRRFVRRVCQYAALLAFAVALSYGGWMYLGKAESVEVYSSIVVGKGEDIKKISLADGTVAWLKEASTLWIPETFSANYRKVILEGEAYFDVKIDTLRPFIVDANIMSVKVLGTSFNLKADKEKGEVETILVRGKVMLQSKSGHDIFQMSPNEKVVYSLSNNQYHVETVNPVIYTSWHLDQLFFENATLREIANKLSLIYNVNINLQSKQLADRRYRCVINRDETLVEVLNILSYLAPINYRIEENEVFISK